MGEGARVGKGVKERVGKGVKKRKAERLTRTAIETHRQNFESPVEVRPRHAD